MEEDEQLRSFMFLMTYLLLKRWRDINNANVQRRNEIQRRIRHRQYFFQRQRRMLLVSPPLKCCLKKQELPVYKILTNKTPQRILPVICPVTDKYFKLKKKKKLGLLLFCNSKCEHELEKNMNYAHFSPFRGHRNLLKMFIIKINKQYKQI